MKINESKEKRLSTLDAAVRASSQSVRVSKNYLNALNVGDDDSDEEEMADPCAYLSAEERRKWNSLSHFEKQYFQKQATKQKQKHSIFEEEKEFFEEERAGVSDYSRRQSDQSFEKSDGYRVRESGAEYAVERRETLNNTEQGNAMTNGSTSVSKSQGMTQISAESFSIIPSAETAASSSAVSSSVYRASASSTAAAAGGPVTVAADAGKKVAEKFQEYLQSQSQTAAQDLPEKCMEWGKGGGSLDTLPGAVRYGMATVAALTLTAGAAIIQGVVSVLTTMLSSLIAVFLPLLLVICLVVSLIPVLAGTVNSEIPAGTGADIVQVALSQEGRMDGSPYWEYTMGSTFIDGSRTPWCACFVSWCANECGYIESGLFPKSGSVLSYKNFFTAQGHYLDADYYIPKTGDLIVFSGGAHIAIVQYVEGNRVVTIEGNASDAVHTRSYTLTNQIIDGYCIPQYPAEVDMSVGSNVRTAYEFFREKGCSKIAAVAIVANLMQESGVDPACEQEGGPGRGICQWEGGRLNQLRERAQEAGKPWYDIEVQLEFLWYELNGGETACQYIMNRDYGGLENFKNATDLEWAVEAFERSFERASVPMMEKRIQYAWQIYRQIEDEETEDGA